MIEESKNKPEHKMKLVLTLACLAAMLLNVSAAPPTQDAKVPLVPIGVLSAYPTVVQTGTNPTLTWGISYPAKVSDVAVINPPGSIVLKNASYVSVQPIGTSFTDQGNPTELRMSVNGGAYQQLFYGTNTAVASSFSLYIKKLNAGTTIDFGGRGVVGPNWSNFYTSKSANMQVIALVNGDTPPTASPLFSSPELKGYLKPYLNGSGKVQIGPLSVLVMMELVETAHSKSTFDYQDQVLLVTFSNKHPNNGHGNNLDGVDSSNPGQGHGGPNGEVDPSGGVDDESK